MCISTASQFRSSATLQTLYSPMSWRMRSIANFCTEARRLHGVIVHANCWRCFHRPTCSSAIGAGTVPPLCSMRTMSALICFSIDSTNRPPKTRLEMSLSMGYGAENPALSFIARNVASPAPAKDLRKNRIPMLVSDCSYSGSAVNSRLASLSKQFFVAPLKL
jgi:hypothetical protein